MFSCFWRWVQTSADESATTQVEKQAVTPRLSPQPKPAVWLQKLQLQTGFCFALLCCASCFVVSFFPPPGVSGSSTVCEFGSTESGGLSSQRFNLVLSTRLGFQPQVQRTSKSCFRAPRRAALIKYFSQTVKITQMSFTSLPRTSNLCQINFRKIFK